MNAPNALRRRVHDILEREDPDDPTTAWVFRGIVALIVVNVVAAILLTDDRFRHAFPYDFRMIEAISLVVFGGEYLLRLWSCVESPRLRGRSPLQARLSWARSPAAIVDLAALLPFAIMHLYPTDIRALALVRLLRFFKLARYSPGLASLLEAVRAERHALLACFVVMCGGIVIFATAMYELEGPAQPDKFGSIPLAMWWAVVTITTVGYGDVVPLSGAGRIVAGLTMIAGIFLLALPVGIVASSFIEVIRRRHFMVTWGMVARVPMFADLDAATLAEIIPRLKARAADAGQVIVPRGRMPRAVFFVISGAIVIETAMGTRRLAAGSAFGETREDDHPHLHALVRAIEETRLLVLDSDDLDSLVAAVPGLAGRLAGVSVYEVG